jgi:low affinity Fe/Cu permease
MERGQLGDSRTGLNPIAKRTAQLPFTSKVLHRIEHYSSLPSVAIAVVFAVMCLVGIVAALHFPKLWVNAVEVGVSAVTLVMVFTIQHTQGREQAATQHKLDELLRALPGADDGLMGLEEAPQQVLLDVEAGHRDLPVGESGGKKMDSVASHEVAG